MTTPETKWLQERASEIVQERDRLRAELARAEGEADRLRSAYDDARALNIKLTMTCTAELAAKNTRIAQLEAWRAACQEVRCYRVVEAETEALRKQLAEFGAGEDTTTMTRKSFAEVLQALADAQAGNEAKDARMAELEATLRASPAAQRQRADFERHRYVDRGEPRVMPKDGFINDYD